MIRIVEFKGAFRFLSNFWPVWVTWDDETYPSVEHAYQAAKTLSPTERNTILRQLTPAAAKRAGKQVTLRADWEEVKIQVMRHLVTQKFTNPELAEALLKTGDVLLQEGNHWGDTFWGINLATGRGENNLGQILMDVRSNLRIQRGG